MRGPCPALWFESTQLTEPSPAVAAFTHSTPASSCAVCTPSSHPPTIHPPPARPCWDSHPIPLQSSCEMHSPVLSACRGLSFGGKELHSHSQSMPASHKGPQDPCLVLPNSPAPFAPAPAPAEQAFNTRPALDPSVTSLPCVRPSEMGATSRWTPRSHTVWNNPC